jgi:2',3'-cyclic-nucleotide 2'-phosphodiesterase (5'-nucleotidase family)
MMRHRLTQSLTLTLVVCLVTAGFAPAVGATAESSPTGASDEQVTPRAASPADRVDVDGSAPSSNATTVTLLAYNDVQRRDDAAAGLPGPGTQNVTVVERGGVRVGYVGLADEGAMNGKTNDAIDRSGYEVRDFVTVGARKARMLERERDVDVVVALAHTGVPDAKALADASDAVDVVVVGDDEIRYPPRETSGTVVVEGVARAEYLGEIDLTVADGEVTSWEGRLIPVTESSERNETAATVVDGYRAEYGLDSNVTRSEVALDARFATNYHRESNYGNYVTDSMRRATGADVAVQNAGGIRSNAVYGPGNLTGGDVLSTLPFGNTIHVVRVNGTELRAALASQVVTLESETGQQFGEGISQQVSGVTFEWVPHASPGQPGGEIRDLTVNGEPADPNETYTVAAPDYIATGGAGYYPVVGEPRNRTGIYTATAVLNNMRAAESIARRSRAGRAASTPPSPRRAAVGTAGTARSPCA